MGTQNNTYQDTYNDDPEFKEFIDETFADKLREMGFELLHSATILFHPDRGAHLFVFELADEKEVMTDQLNVISQPDYDQPQPNWSFHYGDLYVTLPFNA